MPSRTKQKFLGELTDQELYLIEAALKVWCKEGLIMDSVKCEKIKQANKLINKLYYNFRDKPRTFNTV